MNDALARLRAELEAAAAKDKADALSAQEAKLTVRLGAPARQAAARRHAALTPPLFALSLLSPGCVPG